MKKLGIIVVLCVLLAILFVKTKQMAVPPPPAVSQVAMQQPVEPTSVNPPEPVQQEPQAQMDYSQPPITPGHAAPSFNPPEIPGNYGSLATIPGPDGNAAICSGKTINDLLSAHGNLWGRSNPSSRLTDKENGRLYGQLVQFFACQAAARDNVKMCNFLPAADFGSKRGNSPSDSCYDSAGRILFYAYALGKSKNAQPCMKYFEGGGLGKLPATSTELCTAAGSGGFEAMCRKFPNRRMCNAAFPTGRDACSNVPCVPKYEGDCDASRVTGDCLNRYGYYSAIKNKDASACPSENRVECEAYLAGSTSVCASLLGDIGKTYCAASQRPEPKRAVIKMPKAGGNLGGKLRVNTEGE